MKRYLLFTLVAFAIFASCTPFIEASHGGATYNFVNTTWEGYSYPVHYTVTENVYAEDGSFKSTTANKSITVEKIEVKFSKLVDGEGTFSIKRTTLFAEDFPQQFGPAVKNESGDILKSVSSAGWIFPYFGETFDFAGDSVTAPEKLNKYSNWAGKVTNEHTTLYKYWVSKNNHQYDYLLLPIGYESVEYTYGVEQKVFAAPCYEAVLSDEPISETRSTYKVETDMSYAETFAPTAQGGNHLYTVSKINGVDTLMIDMSDAVLTKKKGGK